MTAATLAVVIPACSGDPEPGPTSQDLADIGAVLCEIQATQGSVFDGSEVVRLTDCP